MRARLALTILVLALLTVPLRGAESQPLPQGVPCPTCMELRAKYICPSCRIAFKAKTLYCAMCDATPGPGPCEICYEKKKARTAECVGCRMGRNELFCPACLTRIQTQKVSNERIQTFSLTSPAFTDTFDLPERFTADGANTNPPLAWSAPPPRTTSLAILMEDLDAPDGPAVQWLLYNIPPSFTSMPEGVSSVGTLNNGAMNGVNRHGGLGYLGPAPEIGTGVHRYRFQLLAIKKNLELAPGLSRDRFLEAAEGYVIATAEITANAVRGAVVPQQHIPLDTPENIVMEPEAPAATAPIDPTNPRRTQGPIRTDPDERIQLVNPRSSDPARDEETHHLDDYLDPPAENPTPPTNLEKDRFFPYF